MARIRANNVFGDADALTDVGTTLTSAGLANLPVVGSPDIAAIILDPDRVDGAPEIVHVTAHTASATTATIVRGQEGTTARAHAANTPWVHTTTAEDIRRPYDSAMRTSGGVNIPASAGLNDVDTGMDLTVPARAGDILKIGVSGVMDGADGSNWAVMDVATIVAAARTNYVSSGGSTAATLGELSWFMDDLTFTNISGEVPYVVQAGDVSSGEVTLRLLARTSSIGRTIRASTGEALKFWVTNVGS